MFSGNGVALAMPFPRFAGHSAKMRGVFQQGHRKYQSFAPYSPLPCSAHGHIPPLPCRLRQWVSARPSRDTSVLCR